MTHSCLEHVKRRSGVNGGGRPDAPAVHVDATAVVDRSGSMANLLPGALTGVRYFVAEQRGRCDAASDSYLEFVSFDDKVEIAFTGKKEEMMDADVQRCLGSLWARNYTRLFDTAIEALSRQNKRLDAWMAARSLVQKRLDVKPVAVYFLLTDGQDNRSLADEAALNRAVSASKKKWKCEPIFAAANQDAMAAGARYGFSAETTLQMDADAQHCDAVFRCVAACAARQSSGAPPAMTSFERGISSQQVHARSAPPAPMMTPPQRASTNYSRARCPPAAPRASRYLGFNHAVLPPPPPGAAQLPPPPCAWLPMVPPPRRINFNQGGGGGRGHAGGP
jgi:hypothetical protein